MVKKEVKIQFRDSLLTLPASLRNLSKSFRVESKGIFPYNFVNDVNINLDYKGEVPGYNFFNKVSESDYNDYKVSYNGVPYGPMEGFKK